MCTSPLDGWLNKDRSVNGKRSVVFDIKKALHDRPVVVPCGRCMECRLQRKREWALRCEHEASLHEDNCWLTLTYDEDNLPERGSLRKQDLSSFLKRLRSRYGDRRFKFFGCGEYGGSFNRPHYHLLLFGLDFPDKVWFSKRRGFNVFTSKVLDETWSKGLTEIGEVSFDGMAYLAKYVTKKDPWEEDLWSQSLFICPEVDVKAAVLGTIGISSFRMKFSVRTPFY
jgi:hypothetical protein